jgi:hypothetical protein
MSDSCAVCDDPISLISPIPGPRGPAGSGAGGSQGPAGVNAFTTTSASFVQPAEGNSVSVSVGSTAWMGVGQAIFIETAGYFTVASIVDAGTVSLTRTAVPGFATTGATVASGKKVSPGGYAYVDNGQYSDLDGRVTSLESAVPATPLATYFQSTAPTGSIAVGSLWIDTDDNYTWHRWDGSGWVAFSPSIELPDFGVDLKPVRLVSSLPSSGMTQGDVVFLSTDNKLYRYTGTAWTAAIAGSDITGTIDGSQLLANSIVAGKIAAAAINSTHVGTNLLVAYASNIQDAIITSAKIISLEATKLTAGTIDSQIIKIKGASGSIQSDNFVAGTTGFRIKGDGGAEFNDVTIRGYLEAASIRTDSALYNAGNPANKCKTVVWRQGLADNGGSGYTTITAGIDLWLTTFYGWGHGSGTVDNRFGKSTMTFDCSQVGGSTPTSPNGWVDVYIIYRVNGGAAQLITPFACRAISGNGSLNSNGAVEIGGLGAGDVVEFGVRAVGYLSTCKLNVTQLTVRGYNL